MNGFIRLPGDWQSVVGIALIAILAVAVARRIPVVKTIL